MNIKALAVFCGSKNGKDPVYNEHAAMLGKLLAQHQIRLIYGGGRKGIMGTIADAVMRHQGTVTGVITEKLIEWEHQHEGITELLVVDHMHTRKKKMYELCDAAMILAGGFGTLDELFEMVTWNQLSIHNKHIFLLNSNGFYDHLIRHIQHLEQSGFLYDNVPERIHYLSGPEELLPYIR